VLSAPSGTERIQSFSSREETTGSTSTPSTRKRLRAKPLSDEKDEKEEKRRKKKRLLQQRRQRERE